MAGDKRVALGEMLRSIGLRRIARVLLEHVLAPDDAEKIAPLLVVVDQEAQETVTCRVRIAVLGEQAWIAHRPERGLEGHATPAIGEYELGQRFEHRDFDRLAAASAFAVEEGGSDRIHGVKP